ncbi:hypothetical protein [Bradyrhizobium sp. TM239]|uniref:hypothetical protein n=1 Tax=Bradyrhizobium sp. TM239 TaxID=2599802 RepID=UPI0027D69E5B|nr:hypothetical protein TM239_31880 [Bradyrhizobium sp. TM239]
MQSGDTADGPAELNELNRLCRYLISEKTRGPSRQLVDAIDNCVEQLTGDRTKLHPGSFSI